MKLWGKGVYAYLKPHFRNTWKVASVKVQKPTVPTQCLCVNHSNLDSDICLWLLSSLNIFTTTHSIHKQSQCAWVTYTTHLFFVCRCVYVICVCGHRALWFGVWEWPTIKTHSSTHCLNYRRALGWESGVTPHYALLYITL